MQKFSQEHGEIREAKEVAYQTGVDTNIGRNHVLLYDMTYEHGRARERMVLTLDRSGQMQRVLAGNELEKSKKGSLALASERRAA